MKCKVLSLFLCCCLCCCLFSLNSSAVEYDEATGRLIWTYDELQQFGAVFEADGSYYFPTGTYHPDELYSLNPLLVTDKYNTTFDMNSLPWESFPTVVQDIIYMNLDGYAFLDTDSTKFIIPFVVLIVTQTAVEIYAGTNLCLGMREGEDRLCICSVPALQSAFLNSKCYYAKYRLSDYSVVTDWNLLTPLEWGDSGKVNYYNRFPLSSDNYDVYIYGGNGSINRDVTSFVTNLTGSTASDANATTVRIYQDIGLGYTSGRYFYNQDYYNICWQYFYPPTVEELEAQTSKSILQTLKNIPSNIANSIKSFFTDLGEKITALPSTIVSKLTDKLKALFIPDDEFMEEYRLSFQENFTESLGLLYEIPEFTIDILQQFVDFKPLSEGYYIQIPDVKLPIRHEDGVYRDFQIFEEQKYYLNFLDEGAIGILYSFYRAFMWLLSIFALIRFAIRKYDKVIGSGTG